VSKFKLQSMRTAPFDFDNCVSSFFNQLHSNQVRIASV